MSAHDSHSSVPQTTGIWFLPLAFWIIVLALLVTFTWPIFPTPEAGASHEGEKATHQTEKSHH